MKNIIKARILVKNAFIKISMTQIFKASSPQDFKIIYRVDNQYELSPHNFYGWNSDDKMRSFLNSLDAQKNPLPENDNFELEEKQKLDSGEYGNFYFGFKDVEQHNRWFTPEQIHSYQEEGFVLRKYKASEIYDSGNQIFFLPLGGDLENARG